MRRDEALRLLTEHRAELEEMGVTSLALFGEVRPVWVAENKAIENLSDQPAWYQFAKFPLGGGHVLFGATFYF